MINRKVYALFKINKVNFIVIAAHLCARDTNKHVRKKELESISDLENLLLLKGGKINDEVRDAISQNNVILLGDLNLHHPNEIELLENTGFFDLWLEKHSHTEGITWNPSVNHMINVMLPFDNRRMRLDRLCLKESKQIALEDISIFSNRRIGK
mmetsp:Transcript_27469/g.24348  ORF Transcript_27469/g.24348 Transcript_27469/m.24348 type:complete len:154 (+) Transcript_27469:326-787(+)